MCFCQKQALTIEKFANFSIFSKVFIFASDIKDREIDFYYLMKVKAKEQQHKSFFISGRNQYGSST